MIESIYQNESYWKDFDEKQLDVYANKIFNYYRKKGFPFYSTSIDYRDNEFRKFFVYDCSNIIKNKNIKQTMHALGLAWSYICLLYTSPSPRDGLLSRMPSSA